MWVLTLPPFFKMKSPLVYFYFISYSFFSVTFYRLIPLSSFYFFFSFIFFCLYPSRWMTECTAIGINHPQCASLSLFYPRKFIRIFGRFPAYQLGTRASLCQLRLFFRCCCCCCRLYYISEVNLFFYSTFFLSPVVGCCGLFPFLAQPSPSLNIDRHSSMSAFLVFIRRQSCWPVYQIITMREREWEW